MREGDEGEVNKKQDEKKIMGVRNAIAAVYLLFLEAALYVTRGRCVSLRYN